MIASSSFIQVWTGSFEGQTVAESMVALELGIGTATLLLFDSDIGNNGDKWLVSQYQKW